MYAENGEEQIKNKSGMSQSWVSNKGKQWLEICCQWDAGLGGWGVQKKAKGESLKLYVVFQPFLVFFKVLLLPMN